MVIDSPIAAISVGSQSETCMRLVRVTPLLFTSGLCRNDTALTPPSHIVNLQPLQTQVIFVFVEIYEKVVKTAESTMVRLW